MSALTRTMAEVAISACYLQIAEEVEVQSFRNFDTQKTLKMAVMLEPFLGPNAVASKEHKIKLEAMAAKAKTFSQREDTQPSWSKKSVYEQAKALDLSMKKDRFVILKASTWEYAHPYVHGTFRSFRGVASQLKHGVFPHDKERKEEMYHSIAGANLAIVYCCEYVVENLVTGELQHNLYSRIAAAFELGNQD
jgi:hypothetical protein